MQRSRSSAIAGEIGIGFSSVRFGKRHPRVAGAVAERQVLERALAALVADRAVERVVDEDELERRVLRLGRHRRGRGGLDHHPVGGGQRAGGLRLRRPGRDLAEAHAAGADRRPEPRLVAEDGDLDPGVERRLDEPQALRHLDLDVVDRDRDELGLLAVRAHDDHRQRLLDVGGAVVLLARREDPLDRRVAVVRAAALLDVGDELVAPLRDVATSTG